MTLLFVFVFFSSFRFHRQSSQHFFSFVSHVLAPEISLADLPRHLKLELRCAFQSHHIERKINIKITSSPSSRVKIEFGLGITYRRIPVLLLLVSEAHFMHRSNHFAGNSSVDLDVNLLHLKSFTSQEL